jgi:hypothetical protein
LPQLPQRSQLLPQLPQRSQLLPLQSCRLHQSLGVAPWSGLIAGAAAVECVVAALTVVVERPKLPAKPAASVAPTARSRRRPDARWLFINFPIPLISL